MNTKNLILRLFIFLWLVVLGNFKGNASAQGYFEDPYNYSSEINSDEDENKSVEQLIQEAVFLMIDERLLEARTKLLTVLKKDPTQYKAHLLLANYYLAHVGHFRLALRYVKQAEELFIKQNGSPPYFDEFTVAEHSRILYLVSEARLNLDNYQGALDVLDNFTNYGYTAEWYPGTKSWILMKLGRLNEAITVAKQGIIDGAEPGRTYNILGILLSMTDKRKEALEVFQDAIMYEFSLGKGGQPATPLNNSGEVYREIFEDEKAEGSWIKSTRLPDGCEHVLPTMNLVLLYTDNLEHQRSKESLDRFEECVKQFPLRNGEEHRALVHLARGRIDLHTGNTIEAIKHFEDARERKQWFGKIGTSIEDMKVASNSSLMVALNYQNKIIKRTLYSSISERLAAFSKYLRNAIDIWWLGRRSRQILLKNLNSLEDLSIRNTDCMLEYALFGTILKGFPPSILRNRIAEEIKIDLRPQSKPYYLGYLAESELNFGNNQEGLKLIDEALSKLRSDKDRGLELHLRAIRAQILLDNPTSNVISELLNIFKMEPAAIKNYGLALPVKYSGDFSDIVQKGNFIIDQNSPFQLSINQEGSLFKVTLGRISSSQVIQTVKKQSINQAINRLRDLVFAGQR